MSVARLALRLSAIEALRGRTLVGDNVLDSEIGAIGFSAEGLARTEQQAPFIAVYTEGSIEDRPDRQFTLLKNGEVDILFEYGFAQTMAVTDPDSLTSTIINIPATDAAGEAYLDIVGREIINALSDPENKWGRIFTGLFTEVVKIVRRRTSGDTPNSRLAAHQLVVTVKPHAEPSRGFPHVAASPYMVFLEELASKDCEPGPEVAEIIRGLIEGGSQLTIDRWQRAFVNSKSDAELLGLGEGTWPSEIKTIIDSPFAPTPERAP